MVTKINERQLYKDEGGGRRQSTYKPCTVVFVEGCEIPSVRMDMVKIPLFAL